MIRAFIGFMVAIAVLWASNAIALTAEPQPAAKNESSTTPTPIPNPGNSRQSAANGPSTSGSTLTLPRDEPSRETFSHAARMVDAAAAGW